MTYTFGCSFTKWFWPTWADWLQYHTNDQVINLGWIGIANETIYWELMARSSKIKKNDTVFIMLTGNNRTCAWLDEDWINTTDCKGFFPRQDGKLECSDNKWQGLYRTPNEPSLTEMIISNFNLILQMQNVLDKIGCTYTMMFWQNPWHDTRPITTPVWKSTWNNVSKLTNKNIKNAKEISNIPAVKNMLNMINWESFCGLTNFSIDNFNSYTGLWEYNLKHLKQNLKYTHKSDPHPDTVTHYKFLTEVILNVNATYLELAVDNAEQLNSCDVSYEYSFLIPDNLDEKIHTI